MKNQQTLRGNYYHLFHLRKEEIEFQEVLSKLPFNDRD